MKVIDIQVSRLLKADLLEFFHNFTDEVKKCATITTAMSGWWTPFAECLRELERISTISLKSDLTDEIHTLKARRYTMLVSLKAAIDSMRKSTDEEVMRTATSIYNSINSFKVNGRANYIAQTGQFDTILEVLTKQQAANVEKLGLTFIVEQAAALNEQMHSLIGDRDQENIDRVEGAFQQARTEAEQAYRDLVTFINAWVLVEVEYKQQPDESLTHFVEMMNSIIVRFKRVALKTSTPSPEAGDDEENPDDPSDPIDPENPGGTPVVPDDDEEDSGTDKPTDPDTPDNNENGGNTGNTGNNGGDTGGGSNSGGSDNNPGVGGPITPGPGGDDDDL